MRGSNKMRGVRLSAERGMMDCWGEAGEPVYLPTAPVIKHGSSLLSNNTMRSNNLQCLWAQAHTYTRARTRWTQHQWLALIFKFRSVLKHPSYFWVERKAMKALRRTPFDAPLCLSLAKTHICLHVYARGRVHSSPWSSRWAEVK